MLCGFQGKSRTPLMPLLTWIAFWFNHYLFLAMVISPKSPHAKKTIALAGLDKLSGLFLVQVERLVTENAANRSCIPNSGAVNRVIYTSAAAINSSSPNIGGRSNVNAVACVDGNTSLMGRIGFFGGGSEAGSSQGPSPPPSMSVPPEDPLEEGDILWYAGPASAIADLRKIPGLVSFEDDELKQINEKVSEIDYAFIHSFIHSFN